MKPAHRQAICTSFEDEMVKEEVTIIVNKYLIFLIGMLDT
jgi:hypothetical protein